MLSLRESTSAKEILGVNLCTHNLVDTIPKINEAAAPQFPRKNTSIRDPASREGTIEHSTQLDRGLNLCKINPEPTEARTVIPINTTKRIIITPSS